MKHSEYTIFALRNAVVMAKRYRDPDCRFYAVALNLLTLLLDKGDITGKEYGKLTKVFSRLNSESLKL